MNNNRFIKLAKLSLVFVYLVIIAGAVVRMTGSGMGCPDWPKCFGYYIPPTNQNQLLWHPNQEYIKGQVIIKDEALYVARENFKSANFYDSKHWEKYTKHNYAVFNVYHTWTEYINRLFGALAGFSCLALFISSFAFWKTNKSRVLQSALVLIFLFFNAWLGATVVFSVLNPIKITTHMVVALLTVAMLIYTIYKAEIIDDNKPKDKSFKWFSLLGLLLVLIQIILGTQVRQSVDFQVRLGVEDNALWIENISPLFYVHRSFSILLVAVSIYLFLRNKKLQLKQNKLVSQLIIFCFLSAISGIVMVYFDFPFASQALHLVVASLFFGVQFRLLMNVKK